MPVIDGFITETPEKASRAVIADKYAYTVQSDVKQGTVDSVFIETNSYVGTPVIDMSRSSYTKSIETDELRKEIYKLTAIPEMALLLDTEVSSQFPKIMTQPYSDELKELYQTKYKGVPVTTCIKQIPVPRVNTLRELHYIDGVHQKIRQSDKKHGKTSVGYYYFSASKSVVKTLTLTTDLRSIMNKLSIQNLEVNVCDKKFTQAMAYTMIANSKTVKCRSSFISQPDPKHILSGDYGVGTEKERLFLLTEEMWPPSYVGKSGAIKRVQNYVATEDIRARIESFLKFPTPICTLVHLTPELEGFVQYLYPTSRAEKKMIWLLNVEVNVFKNLDQYYNRTAAAIAYRTWYPFSRANFHSHDVYYTGGMTNAWKLSMMADQKKTVEENVLQINEMDVAPVRMTVDMRKQIELVVQKRISKVTVVPPLQPQKPPPIVVKKEPPQQKIRFVLPTTQNIENPGFFDSAPVEISSISEKDLEEETF